MPPSPSLLSIIAHARSGALDHAWRLFREAGLEAVTDDPAVLSLRGRLLKDQALAAEAGAARRALYGQAGEAYGRAAALSGAAYPLINAATLALLAGELEPARDRARAVLARLDAGEAEPDTPYYVAATRAEALLLLGQTAAAGDALEAAIALAPRAWEDHASTLIQFGRILAATGADAAWLAPLAPPRSLHFAGHMAVAPESEALAAQVSEALAAERVGFGFGALAAGADIVVAEALLARGAELHLVLAAPPAAFRAASAAGQGDAWGARFDAVVARAETVRGLGHPDDPPHPLGVRLAAEAAMGQAVMHARALASQAVQLLILDAPAADGHGDAAVGDSAWMGGVWRAAGLRQRVILAPRVGTALALAPAAPAVLTAMLAVEVADAAADSLAGAAWLAQTVLPRLDQALAEGPAPLAPPERRGRALTLTYAAPAQAAAVALALVAALRGTAAIRVAGAYGLARREPGLWLGPVAPQADAVLASTPVGAIHVTEVFAAAMQVGPGGPPPRAEYVGELPADPEAAPTRLFSLKAGL